MKYCALLENRTSHTVNPADENYLLMKRTFLRKSATLFDPMGFRNPYLRREKILPLEMWTLGLEWDDLLDKNHGKKANRWFAERQQLAGILVPLENWLQLEKRVIATTTHTFMGASGEA